MTSLSPTFGNIADIFAKACAFEAGYDCGRNKANPTNTHPSNFTTLEKCQAYERGYAKGRAERYVPPTRDCPKDRNGHTWHWDKDKKRSVCQHCDQVLSDEELAMCPSCDTCEIHPSQEDVCTSCRGKEEIEASESYSWSRNSRNGVTE